MAKMTIDTDELHKHGRELGFICAELVAGFVEGMNDYWDALKAAQEENKEAAVPAEEQQQ